MDFEELGRRAVAWRGWRGWPGMRVINPRFGDARIVAVAADGSYFVFKEARGVEGYRDPRDDDPSDIPDLADPATLRCLLELVREAWSCPTACVVHEGSDHPDPWAVRARRGEALGIGVTEAEALVLALEAAP